MPKAVELAINLHRQTVTLLQNRPRTLTLEKIADEANVNYHWLARLSRDAIEEPGVNKIAKVFQYLTNYKPEA